MASSSYSNARCGECLYWKVTRDPLGKCRIDLEYQNTIGRFCKACSAFEAQLTLKQQSPAVKEHPLVHYKR